MKRTIQFIAAGLMTLSLTIASMEIIFETAISWIETCFSSDIALFLFSILALIYLFEVAISTPVSIKARFGS